MRPPRPSRTPTTVDSAWVDMRVAAYLGARTCPRDHLRRLIARKIDKALEQAGDRTQRETLLAALEAALDRAERAGLLNDAAWAASRTRRLVERGVAPAVIGGRLASKGIESDVRKQAMVDTEEELGDPMQVSALAYARRRHLGPWRVRHEADPDDRAAVTELYESDLGMMARAGFPYAIARAVLRSTPDDA